MKPCQTINVTSVQLETRLRLSREDSVQNNSQQRVLVMMVLLMMMMMMIFSSSKDGQVHLRHDEQMEMAGDDRTAGGP